MSAASVLVIDGNRAATREEQVAAGGSPTGEGYARTLQSLANVRCELVRPADGEVRLEQDGGLAGYDGVAITGSALNIYDGGPHIARQIELAGAAFAAGVPFFGSCWGMQVAVTAAGGRVRPNPLGREFGFARRIELNEEGRRHPMFAGKPAVFEAITVHRDDIAEVPAGAVVLASNEMGVQALELRHERGVFWGVQYHPEYSFSEIAACAVRYGAKLIEEGLFSGTGELQDFVAELRRLERHPADLRLGWKHGLGPAVQQSSLKLAELRNWLEIQVLPYARRRRALAKARP